MMSSWIESYGDRYFKHYDLSELKRDECFLTISNDLHMDTYLFSTYDECLNCAFYKEAGPFVKNSIETIKINTKHEKLYRMLTHTNSTSIPHDYDENIVWESDKGSFGEFGVYGLNTSASYNGTEVLKQPVNIYLPILAVFLIYSVIFFVIYLLQCVNNKLRKKEGDDAETITKKLRVKSIDTFRGICIVLMIFVNYGHGGYQFLEHAIWNGLYIGDLVFPWFMWIMGVCIPISIASIQKNNISKITTVAGILKRSSILFALGLFLGAGSNLHTLRIFGVLQRFAVCYLIVAVTSLFTIDMLESENETKFKIIFKDLLRLKAIWVLMVLVVAVHTYLIFFYEVPNCPISYLGYGGDHMGGIYKNCTGGMTGYVDKIILGKHVFRYSLITTLFNGQAFDPEGILGCLTSVFQVFLGVQAGAILKLFQNHRQRVYRWLFWATVTGILGGILCGFSKENGVIPINKNLWSLSFVLVTSSLAYLLFALCYIIVDVKRVWTGKPFLFAGMNSILLYVGHNMTYTNFPIRWYISEEVKYSTHFITLMENVWATCCWIIISYYLYRIKFFLSI